MTTKSETDVVAIALPVRAGQQHGYPVLLDASGIAVAECYHRETAEYLARCLNSHARLVEACEAAIEFVRTYYSQGDAIVGGPPVMVFLQCEAALAAAKE